MLALLCSLASFFLAVHLVTLATAFVRCRLLRRVRMPAGGWPAVTVVRPLCGLETFSRETLHASFALDYPAFELIFCVARGEDPIVPLVERAIADHPTIAARLIVGDEPISTNPKLNNMVKGWRAAAHPFIAFIDSNVLVTPDFVHHLVAAWRPDTGCVAAPPVGTWPRNFGAHLECAFLNAHEARWQYVVDTFGSGFAQGKSLFYRKADLDRSAMRDLAAEPAEDAATTKMVRAMGLRVRLAPPSPQPLGARPLKEVWGRQLRWARLRRATFPLEFLPEILSGSIVATLATGCAAAAIGWNVPLTLAAYLAIWYAAELALILACRWPFTALTLPASVLRDLLLPALWVAALAGRSYTWKGAALEVEARGKRPDLRRLRPDGP